jgi:hypothetical protein
MSLSARSRRKGAAKAAALLPRGSTVRAYAVGRKPAAWTDGVTATLAVFGAIAAALFIGFGLIPVPGVLWFIVVHNAAAPMRAVVVADQGLALLARRGFDAKANRVLALAPSNAVARRELGKKVELRFGDEVVLLNAKEDRELTRALSAVHRSTPGRSLGARA